MNKVLDSILTFLVWWPGNIFCRSQEVTDLYRVGRIPIKAELAGVWKVKMWGWWRLMRLDRKHISGNKGYNKILGARWGTFRIENGDRSLMLVYDDGKITDYLRLHPTNNDLMIGRFCRNGEYKAMFTLERA